MYIPGRRARCQDTHYGFAPSQACHEEDHMRPGLMVSAGATLTFTPSNREYPLSVTVTADSSGKGKTTFTVTAAV
jgi:hypothetical protein